MEAASHQPNRPDSVYPLELLKADQQVGGIKCPYEHLWSIDKELKSHPSIQLYLLSAFFEIQAFLINHCPLLLNDPVKGFMFNRKGSIRYIDYGRSIISIDDFRCGEDCLDAMCFFRFLFSVAEPSAAIRQTMQDLLYPSCNNRALIEVLLTEAQHDATLKPILRDVNPMNWSCFTMPAFTKPLQIDYCKIHRFSGKNFIATDL